MSRSRTQHLLAATVALSVLLGIVAFVSRGHSEPSGGGGQNRGASQVLANSVFTILFIVMAAGAVGLIWALASQRGRRDKRTTRTMRLVSGFVVLLVVVLVLTIWGRHLHLFHPLQHGLKGAGRPGHHHALTLAQKKKLEQPKTITNPTFQWPLAAGIIALVVGAALTAMLRVKARRDKLSSDVGVVLSIRRVLDDTLDDLRNEADPRKAVIAAYARMERILAANEFPRRPSETPQEYLERVLVDLHVTQPAVERLTELFTRAKFSQHEVDPQMKEDAIEALVALREQVRVIAETVDKPALRLSDLPGAAR